MEKVIVVVGPTGVGKTKMAVALAKYFNGEVISGDSMQIYRMLNIGSAKVTVEEMEGIKHHLIDIKDPDDNYSVKDFQVEVRKKITEVSSRGKIPIIAGGTGLYIKAALYDYEFSDSTIEHDEYIKKYENYTNEELYNKLLEIDKKSAEELHFNNRQRVLRAIAIYESTGVKKSDTLAKQKHVMLYDVKFVGLTLPRELLYERINLRVDSMMEQGLFDEVKKLRDFGCKDNYQSMKGIGYREWFAYFDGEQTFDETIELIKKDSRNYAKRQYTWFKNQMPVRWYDVNLDNFNETINNVIIDLKK